MLLLMAIMFLALLLLKGKAYQQIDSFLNKSLPFLANSPPWLKKLVIILFFFLVYGLLKQLVFWALGEMGFDVQGEMMQGIERLQNGNY